ncbi:hypothetical protein MsAg5_03090 [Methanosarcinaceae archaeon Ag5]|uniref:Uncharacterized protein n=1 Tax=Methanolapillus africanus TaxID=3028297 RepID=A0AAE4SEM8_9EURY|nr:hypothetical protein [Methanosarcinaceae archaeon Ag5]
MNIFIYFALVSLIFVFYLGSKKNFVVIPNQEFNSILTRSFFILPIASGFVIFLSGLFTIRNDYIYSVPITVDVIIENPILLSPFVICALLILFFKKFILKKEMPFELRSDFMNYDFYVFTPIISVIDTKIFKPTTEVESFYEGHKEITVTHQDLKRIDLAYTKSGELIISSEVFEIFNENELTGFQVIPVQYSDSNTQNSKNKGSEIQHFQLITTHIMPPFSKKTTLKLGYSAERIVYDGDICYNREVVQDVLDFNRSDESISGKDMWGYRHQRYWILSKKTVEVLIKELNQPKRDFKPVILVDETEDDEPIINNFKSKASPFIPEKP